MSILSRITLSLAALMLLSPAWAGEPPAQEKPPAGKAPIVRTADLDLGAGPILPRAGDQVRETVGLSVFVYEVNAPGGQPPWRYSDPYRRVLRIHTKHIGTET